MVKITGPMGRVTSIAYDALNRATVVTTPLTGSSNAVGRIQRGRANSKGAGVFSGEFRTV